MSRKSRSPIPTRANSVRLGIVIVNFNVCDLLRSCLTSVYKDLVQAPDLDTRVVVVDNASGDDSTTMVGTEFPQATLIASQENLGFARGNNVGLRALGFDAPAGGPASPPDAVLLLNPDTEVQPGALAALAGFLRTHPQAGGCGPALRYGDGSFQHSAFHFPGLTQLALDLFPASRRLHGRLRNTRLNGRYPLRLYEQGRPFPVDFTLGAALMVRSAAIKDAGLLDEGYFMYVEEMDWCRRLRTAGWPMYCVPAAQITHHEGRSARQFRGAMMVALWRSRLRYYQRTYPAWKQWAARRLVAAGMRAEMRRSRTAFVHGDISSIELETRLDAYRQVLTLVNTPA